MPNKSYILIKDSKWLKQNIEIYQSQLAEKLKCTNLKVEANSTKINRCNYLIIWNYYKWKIKQNENV